MAARKLLFVINHIDWFWSHRLPLAKGAQALGWDVGVAVTGASSDPNLLPQNFKGYDLPASDQGYMPFTLIRIIWRIHRILKVEKPDVVHAITLKYAFLTGLAARFHKNVKVIHTLAGLGYLFTGEGIKPKILRALIGPFLKLALKQRNAYLIFQNPDDMMLMTQRGFAHAERCTLIRGSGVDLSTFSFTPLPHNEAPIILMPTRLVHEKGIAVFIEAANIVKNQDIAARFQIAGGLSTSNPRAISRAEMEGLIAGTEVEWLGKVSDMASLYQSSTLICYPSYYGEGVPKVLLEAASTGRPIVTTDHPGCREAVRHGENGLLVPVKDAGATAKALISLLEDRKKLETMGQSSRKLAEDEYNVVSVVERTLEVYEKALKI